MAPQRRHPGRSIAASSIRTSASGLEKHVIVQQQDPLAACRFDADHGTARETDVAWRLENARRRSRHLRANLRATPRRARRATRWGPRLEPAPRRPRRGSGRRCLRCGESRRPRSQAGRGTRLNSQRWKAARASTSSSSPIEAASCSADASNRSTRTRPATCMSWWSTTTPATGRSSSCALRSRTSSCSSQVRTSASPAPRTPGSASGTHRSCSRSTPTRASRPASWRDFSTSSPSTRRSASAAVGSCVKTAVSTTQHDARSPPFGSPLGHFLGIGRMSRSPRRLAQYRAPDVVEGPVDAVNGAFMLMRRSALDEVGLFDEGYWMYMEDLDLCYRLREAGWTTWYEPSVVVSHVKGGSSGPVRSPRLNYAFHYGMYRFYRKHYAPRSAAVVNALIYAAIFGKLLVSLLRGALRATSRHRHRSPWGRPPWHWRVRAWRRFARTRVGYRIKRALRRHEQLIRRDSPASTEALARRRPRGSSDSIRNVLLVSHGDFTTNSGLHVHAIASELAARGYSPVVALPGRRFGLDEVGPTTFPVVSHRDVTSEKLPFPGGGVCGPRARVYAAHTRAPRNPRRVARSRMCLRRTSGG